MRAFFERATDCVGAYEVTLERPTLVPAAALARFPAGTWERGPAWTWRTRRRDRLDDVAPVLAHAELEQLLTALLAVGAAQLVVRYQYALKHPDTGALLPYAPADLAGPGAGSLWSEAAVALREGAGSSIEPRWEFAQNEITPDVIAVVDAAVATLGLTLEPRHWKRRSRSHVRGAGGAAAREVVTSIRFDRNAWVAPTGAADQRLLAQIVAQPDDDAPRLVYADLLSERGDPRGLVIGVQCELARDERDGCGEVARLDALRVMERKLLAAHGKAWTRVPVPLRGTLHRGFVERIRAEYARHYIERVLALRAVAPLARALTIKWGIDGADFVALAATQATLPLTSLTCVPRPLALRDLAAAAAAVTPFASLHHLQLAIFHPAVVDELIALLSHRRVLPVLTTLTLDGPAIDAAALARVVAAAAGDMAVAKLAVCAPSAD